jgi:hypothetical protein
MPRGEKSGNPKVKHHRATRIAEGMMRQGATRAEANRIATAAMDREYARDGVARDSDAHDSRTGQRKTNLTTKKGAAVSGASKPSAAKKPSRTKRHTKETSRAGKATSARKPRASA